MVDRTKVFTEVVMVSEPTNFEYSKVMVYELVHHINQFYLARYDLQYGVATNITTGAVADPTARHPSSPRNIGAVGIARASDLGLRRPAPNKKLTFVFFRFPGELSGLLNNLLGGSSHEW